MHPKDVVYNLLIECFMYRTVNNICKLSILSKTSIFRPNINKYIPILEVGK